MFSSTTVLYNTNQNKTSKLCAIIYGKVFSDFNKFIMKANKNTAGFYEEGTARVKGRRKNYVEYSETILYNYNASGFGR